MSRYEVYNPTDNDDGWCVKTDGDVKAEHVILPVAILRLQQEIGGEEEQEALNKAYNSKEPGDD